MAWLNGSNLYYRDRYAQYLRTARYSAYRRAFHFGEKGSGFRAPTADAVQDYDVIKQKCLASGQLFEDPIFQNVPSSLYYSSRRGAEFKWLRPSELINDPQFIAGGASRFDVMQGELGDCWLLAAIANLTLNQKLFQRVVPPDQSLSGPSYAGVVHFRFWRYGKWIDVVIDDRLPTINGRLAFMHSKESNEFWSALLEKAYAKLHGSYEALKGGTTCEAMEDFTGGFTEFYDLQSPECPPNAFQIMKKAHERSSFMGCSIDALDSSQRETELANGLIRGHAYSITAVKYVELRTARVEGKIPLLRIRNPWGNEAEWNGPWSDKSREWSVISDEEKQELELTFDSDGEFWMSFPDFKSNFTRLEICNLTPEPLQEDGKSQRQWEASIFDGAWISGVSAGGCRNHIDTFAMNPQYIIKLVDHDEEDDDNLCTVIVALMQKNRRAQRKKGLEALTIGFAIYRMHEGHFEATDEPIYASKFKKQLLTTEYFKYNASVARSPNFINLREVCARFRLEPGSYVIIPSTFDPNEEGEFLLRVYTEKSPEMVEENDDEVAIIEPTKDDTPPEPSASERTAKAQNAATDFFAKIAGDDMEVDAKELQEIINHALKKDFKFEGFGLESCRSMVALMDEDKSGMLGIDEFTQLWRSIRTWCAAFKKHDVDNSNNINATELRAVFQEVGISVNRNILKYIIQRYGSITSGKKGDIKVERALSFDAFITCCIKLRHSIDVWNQLAKNRASGSNRYSSRATLAQKDPNAPTVSMDEWVENMMYC